MDCHGRVLVMIMKHIPQMKMATFLSELQMTEALL